MQDSTDKTRQMKTSAYRSDLWSRLRWVSLTVGRVLFKALDIEDTNIKWKKKKRTMIVSEKMFDYNDLMIHTRYY